MIPAPQSTNATAEFRRARDFPLQHREDYATAYSGFEWPRLAEFNWALDWFDSIAAGCRICAVPEKACAANMTSTAKLRAPQAPPPVYRPVNAACTAPMNSKQCTVTRTPGISVPQNHRPAPVRNTKANLSAGSSSIAQRKISAAKPGIRAVKATSVTVKAPPVYLPQLSQTSTHGNSGPHEFSAPRSSQPVQPAIRPNIAPPLVRTSIQTGSLKPQLRRFFPVAASIQRAEMSTFRPPQGTPLARLNPKIREVRSPQVTEQGFFTSLTGKQKADALFKEFLDLGVGYNLGSSSPTLLLGIGVQPLRPEEPMRRGFDGNCLAMANALAHVFTEAGVSAEAKEVRAEKPGKAFVVHAPNFVDKMVTGHIFKETVLWQNRYLFTNHTATWVPTLNIYYDLMAGTTYQNLDQHIEMELTATDASGDVFEGSYQARVWQLVRRTDIRGPGGGFFRFDMTPKAS